MPALPLGDPNIRVYPHHAFYTAILKQSHASKNWLYTNFLQIMNRRDYEARDCLNYEYLFFHEYEGCPLLEINRIPRDLITGHVSELIIEGLEKGYYCFLFLDEFQLPDRQFTGWKHLYHDHLVYGYLPDQRQFCIAYYNQEGKYTLGAMEEAKLEEAFTPRPGQEFIRTDIGTNNPVRFIRVKTDGEYPFQKRLFADLFSDFTASRNSTRRFPMNFMLEDGGKRAYGLESIRVYAESLNAVRHGHVKLDRRNGYFLQEYMELMYRRFRFLSDQNLFRITDRDTDLLSAACAEMKKGLALVLKYQVRNDPVLLGRAEDTYLSFVDKYQPWFQEMSDRFFEN